MRDLASNSSIVLAHWPSWARRSARQASVSRAVAHLREPRTVLRIVSSQTPAARTTTAPGRLAGIPIESLSLRDVDE